MNIQNAGYICYIPYLIIHDVLCCILKWNMADVNMHLNHRSALMSDPITGQIYVLHLVNMRGCLYSKVNVLMWCDVMSNVCIFSIFWKIPLISMQLSLANSWQYCMKSVSNTHFHHFLWSCICYQDNSVLIIQHKLSKHKYQNTFL